MPDPPPDYLFFLQCFIPLRRNLKGNQFLKNKVKIFAREQKIKNFRSAAISMATFQVLKIFIICMIFTLLELI